MVLGVLGQSSVLAVSHVDMEQKCACAPAPIQVRRIMELSVMETELKSTSAVWTHAVVCISMIRK